MLCMNSYPRDYIDACRAKMEAQLAAYKKLMSAGKDKGKETKSPFNTALNTFEPLFFSNLVVALEGYFVHRSRTIEQKDGNPLNEVRMLASSILLNDGVLTADKSIKYNATKSVLKIQVGEKIKLSEDDFTDLMKAFFVELESKFV